MISKTYIVLDELRRLGPPMGQKDVGLRLGNWLSENYLFCSQNEWLEEISKGRVTVNQFVACSPDYVLRLNDQLSRVHPLSEEPTVDTRIEILFQCSDVAVVSKPAGLPMHEAGFFRRNTVHWLLPRLLGPDWHAVHRLDRETSGVLLCARGRALRKTLAQQIEAGAVHKTYMALCDGVSELDEWTESSPIIGGASPHDPARCGDESHERAQTAVTRFKVHQRSANHSLIEANPVTGRTHQIRVHLAHVGLPIIGDKIYGRDPGVFADYIKNGNTQAVQERAGHARHLLHAYSISFVNPLTRERHLVVSPVPEEMSCVCNSPYFD
jgi:23S rRNA pseudouridine1911/1915/1917 synthase